jgi:hypothetical protein
MSNCIRRVVIENKAITPHAAEIWVTVFPEQITPTTEVRGRLMGPTCTFASTVEVAYPLRPLPKGQDAPAFDAPSITMAISIPEPSLWDPVSPFLYHGQVELWEDGRRRSRMNVRHGLKSSRLTPCGVVWNGSALTVRGHSLTSVDDVDVLKLRTMGFNLLSAPKTLPSEVLWDLADRFGFLMLGWLPPNTQAVPTTFLAYPCHLGWVADANGLMAVGHVQPHTANFVGVELASRPTKPLPRGIDFIVCPATLAADLNDLGLPIISLDDAA